MEQLDLMKTRYSVRKYKDQPVEEAKLNQILEAARVAPTGANRQPFELLVVQGEAPMERMSKAAKTFDAPLAVVVLGNKEKAWTRQYDDKNIMDIDVSIVTDHMMLAATELGLGSVWVCWFKPEVLKEQFNIPAHLEPVNILFMGYGDGTPASPDRHDKMRKPLAELVHYNQY